MHQGRHNAYRDTLNQRLDPLSRNLSRLLRHDEGGRRSGLEFTGVWCRVHDILRLPDFSHWSEADLREVVQDSLSKGRPRFKTDDRGIWICATAKHSYNAVTTDCRGLSGPPARCPPGADYSASTMASNPPQLGSSSDVGTRLRHSNQDAYPKTPSFVGQTMSSSSSRSPPQTMPSSSSRTPPADDPSARPQPSVASSSQPRHEVSSAKGTDPFFAAGGANDPWKTSARTSDDTAPTKDPAVVDSWANFKSKTNVSQVTKFAEETRLDKRSKDLLLEAPAHIQEEAMQDHVRNAANPNAEVMKIVRRQEREAFDARAEQRRREQQNTGARFFGVVHQIKEGGKYGFIQEDCDGSRLFVPPRVCAGGQIPAEGTRVSYEIVEDNSTRKMRAHNVELDNRPVSSTSDPKAQIQRLGDWRCENCNAVNFAAKQADQCYKCGSPKPPSEGDWCCANPRCGRVSPAHVTICQHCLMPKDEEPSTSQSASASSTGPLRPPTSTRAPSDVAQEIVAKGSSSSSSSQVAKPKPPAPTLHKPKPPAPTLPTQVETPKVGPPTPKVLQAPVPKPPAPVFSKASAPQSSEEVTPKKPKAPPPTLTQEHREASSLMASPPRRDSNPTVFQLDFGDDEEDQVKEEENENKVQRKDDSPTTAAIKETPLAAFMDLETKVDREGTGDERGRSAEVSCGASDRVETASTAATSGGESSTQVQLQVTSMAPHSRAWSQYTDPQTKTLYWYHDNDNWFREENSEPWQRYSDPTKEINGRPCVYWWNAKSEEWFYATIIR